MDSTLLDQVRHLCRDRAAYEHLKAILVQQERVHQMRWEERYEKLIAAQSSDSKTDIFSNIIAREKAIAQLADAIQRSPSLELVLQIAVQVAQKLLQVDRVAIFRCYPDGRGEFTTDAIASGLTSLADMPERQLSLARHMIESTDPEQSAQTIDSIRTSSLSSHIVTLLEQIGISSYAANKIYAGQDVWGTLVAFHGSVYHSWSESDRISLSLIAAQIGIAISLTNLRQQSQELTNDLQTLQIELDNLQQTVAELAEKSPNSTDDQTIDAQTINPINQNVFGEKKNNVLKKDLESDDLEIEVISLDEDTDVEESELETIVSNAKETTNYRDDLISRNGLPPLFLVPDSIPPISDTDEGMESDETELLDEPAISFTREDISYVIMPDNLKVISDIASAPDESDQDKSDQDKSLENSGSETEVILPETIILELSESESSISGKIESESSEDEDVESQESEQEIATPELATPELAEIEESESCADEELEPETSKIDFLSEIQFQEPAIPAPEIIQQEVLESETKESVVESMDESQTGVDTTIYFSHNNEEDEEPAIEPQFMETILEIAGNDLKATEFLLNVIDSYLEETPLLVQSIDRALAVDDRARLLQALNTLRSSSDYIGALTLSYQCRQLELAIRANYVVLIYACLSQVAIEAQRATDALRIARSRYAL
ncbi:MAG: GAF domain-containing protein [Pseudanabaena sp.]|jgi:HPt (histidine-containing phosphotransfer) domain-containing protein|nr:GAF domain-containing protein [Pseudanabaena sp. M090S1SP2A07QC]MCA6506067.1 GAF domain-containing protein [Pseudanabaena sp. M172S2SP2A07QC]MCA6522750.1 GAF domain-containing protein [Pseudanabaena sp. M051S1SP2A07QC]MCA6527531.1 GAF domain-containing protein [Pseudanabaena sp. M179S2SP2A07QC]MCA6531707.1 GAF domain-containing protein [Pseudanabaena sp. M125S2SP2A07QC]MCA6534288.1 GAF domain-containing protein [Pseudanabaena sp. M176S2SP2A07QC]MCA6541341.1 GAF domain-containing protein [P